MFRHHPNRLAAGAVSAWLITAGLSQAQAATGLACDDSLKTHFKPDAQTSVITVKSFKQGETLKLDQSSATALPDINTPAAQTYPPAPVDVCLVKLVIGPGMPGDKAAPSTSAGMGIEIWLPQPQRWNQIIRAMGSGGWAGGVHADPAQIGTRPQYIPAIEQGYVVVTSDHGHTLLNNGSFAMLPDGKINDVLWQDFAERSLHEMAVKSKALVRAYYGTAQRYAYWDGFSTGGRQGLKLAQKYPRDFDGILAGAPAINWTKFITGELYPQIVMQRDLNQPMAAAKLNYVSGKAVNACDTLGLGFLLDPLQCRYDPTKDADVLCQHEAGNGVTGTSANPACLTRREAAAVNKIWYGQTRSGTSPDPARDNAAGPELKKPDHLWWGLTRGTNLPASLAGEKAFPIASDLVALELQRADIAGDSFKNASGDGKNGWKTLSYAELAHAYDQGLRLQTAFSRINTDDPNLSGLRAVKGKILIYHGLADEKIMPQGTINYYHRVVAAMGGQAAVDPFVRLYLIPGLAHDSTLKASSSVDPETGRNIVSSRVPLPQYLNGSDQLFTALRNWVEKGISPSTIGIGSSDGSIHMPLCRYPQHIAYTGSGDVRASGSYRCQ
ncbi:tannase/feruloyl esterase family alpha/beta hydrolase [Musicola paradisiaca]|uniref:Tannase and feruloyl esterase n=1 Tax=Musicola paradisiaca (strain Ech703) TaxID=579405 RepID=C6C8C0_MUSP7|nr:tannase/feruloyl esterase family alpha/beta hydrolase [Musicola paradisiaca]ACS86086.1 Tannase and feruloyl esterase [Musicola paradisiaca Ech703]